MKYFLKILNLKYDLFLIFLVSILTVYVWGFLTKLYIWGDGMVYFTEFPSWLNSSKTLGSLMGNFELGPTITAGILGYFFGPHFSWYFGFELITMIIINALFYFMVLVLTKNRLVAIISTIFLAVNFSVNWNMYVNGSYSMFLGRIMQMLFILPSFMLLHLYLEKKKIIFFVSSLFLFFLGVGSSHWFFFFTTPYFVYPIAFSLFSKNNLSQHIKFLFVGLSFVLISGSFWYCQEMIFPNWGGRPWTFSEFVLNPERSMYPEKIARQIAYLTAYPILLKPLFKPSLLGMSPIDYYIGIKDIVKITPYILMFYLVGIFIIHFRLPKFRALLWTLVISILNCFFLSAYLNRYDILNNTTPNRYLYLGGLLIFIFWSLFTWAIFIKSTKKFLIAAIVISFIYIVVNLWLINEQFKRHYVWEIPTTKVYDYITRRANNMPANSLIVTKFEQSGQVEASFLTIYLGKGKIIFLDDHSTKINEVAKKSKLAIKVYYSEECKCILEEFIK